MDTRASVDNYLDELSYRRINISNGIVSLGRLGSLLHPFQLLYYKHEMRTLDRLEKEISNFTVGRDDDKITEYMEKNPILAKKL